MSPRAGGLTAIGAVVAGVLIILGSLYVVRSEAPREVTTSSPTPSRTPTAASPSPTATPAGTPMATVTGSPLPPGTFENRPLGYRITFPEGYRRSDSRLTPGQGDRLGVDSFTPQTEQQAREMCLEDSGDTGFLTWARGDVSVIVDRNPDGLSPEEWVTTPRSPQSQPLIHHSRMESVTINGLAAARLYEDNARAATLRYLISANGRMYEISPTVMPLDGLEGIARSFEAVSPDPLPSPPVTATVPPEQAARAVAARLAAAFSAKDADAVAREMSDCWLFVSPLINGEPAGGVQYRSVARFIEGLRGRFAAGDLTVSAESSLQRNPRAPEAFYVRSQWRDGERTSMIHLYIQEIDGRWIWYSAEPQDGWPCRRPWVDQDSC